MQLLCACMSILYDRSTSIYQSSACINEMCSKRSKLENFVRHRTNFAHYPRELYKAIHIQQYQGVLIYMPISEQRKYFTETERRFVIRVSPLLGLSSALPSFNRTTLTFGTWYPQRSFPLFQMFPDSSQSRISAIPFFLPFLLIIIV